ncbi:hypothetical protein KFE25_002841 [Diacronema lutheri]|uniref:Phosphoglycerate mutase (2,3-diphosphoglycerate-dependent) n=1 Tax=Diacronema lutheri TaxID=2081491 RepID=A0A8J6CAH4_DIALT|nr:hypothetical protein KFE25_002841 [Diacronema lutheri]
MAWNAARARRLTSSSSVARAPRRLASTAWTPPPRLKELVLVRHGESEGNIAHRRSLRGDHSLYENQFFARRHSSLWRLTNRGIEEAIKAGDWLRENIDVRFDRYYVSEYVRAMETAAKLELPGATWYTETFLRERDLGIFDLMSHAERKLKFAEELRRRERDRFFFAPPGGESLADVCLRVDRVINQLHRECQDQRVIIVAHGEVIWCFRIRLERMGQMHYRELEQIQNVHDHIHNCQILHYTRTAPDGTTAPWLTHLRSVCPWDLSRSRNTWEEIERPKYDSVQLMQQVVKVHRIIDDDAAADRLSLAAVASSAARVDRPPPADGAPLRAPFTPAELADNMVQASIFTGADSAAAHPDAWVPTTLAASPGIAARQRQRSAGERAGAQPPARAPSASGDGADDVDGGGIHDDGDGGAGGEGGAHSKAAAAGSAGAQPNPAIGGARLAKGRPLHLKRVALVSKSTRLDRVGSQALNAGDALAARLRDAHVRHATAVGELGAALRAQGLVVEEVGVQNARPDAFSGAELVICAGGDGTFLSTAAHVPPHIPLLGINTDPARSTGALTALTYEPEAAGADWLSNALERLRRGNFELIPRRRLVVSIRPVGGSEYMLPRLALNDVFVSERNSGRVYACEMSGDNGPVRIRRSSGLLFATGTGSSARLRNQIRVDAAFVRHVLSDAAARGAAVAGADGGALTDSECITIAESWSRRWLLPPDDDRMVYSILEPIVPDCQPRQSAGHANWMVVKSLGHNTVLTLDGFYEHPIRYGDELTIAVGDEDSAVLSVVLPGHEIYVPRRGRSWRDI